MSTTALRPAPTSGSPSDLLRGRRYVIALLTGALLGVPVAIVAYVFLIWVDQTQ